ncbi:cyclin-T isoform X2 [Hetaerina americana]|uniref:cyclin-T isoform X2 n=1 Tax=Hetaerina americana TaxID=62018 RepID=UPI003A7F269E
MQMQERSEFYGKYPSWNALFLAAKVEEQPRKLEHVIKVAHICLHREMPPLDTKSEQYLEQAQELVFNENVLLQTLGFDVAIDHPHTHVVRCCQLVRAYKDLAQTSYFMASNSLHLTTMCLQYKPTVVACFCIHLACKWSNWWIPQSSEGKEWFWYVDKTVTQKLLEGLTNEFLVIFDQCPSRLKMKIKSVSAAAQNPNIAHGLGYQLEMDPRKNRNAPSSKSLASAPAGGSSSSQSQRPHHSHPSDPSKANAGLTEEQKKHRHEYSQQRVDYREYKEKKERERAAATAAIAGRPRGEQHQIPNTSQAKQAGLSSGQPATSREAIKLAASNKREQMARDAIRREELASAVLEADNMMVSSDTSNHLHMSLSHHPNSHDSGHRDAKLVTSRPQLPSGSSSRPPLSQRPEFRDRQREERGGERQPSATAAPLFPEGPKSQAQAHQPQTQGETKPEQRPFNHHHHHHHHGRAEPSPGVRDGRHRQPPPGMPNVPPDKKLEGPNRPRDGRENKEAIPSAAKRDSQSRPLREAEEVAIRPDTIKVMPSTSHPHHTHSRNQATPKARSRSPLPPSSTLPVPAASTTTPTPSVHHRPTRPKSPTVSEKTARNGAPLPLTLSLNSASDDSRKLEVTTCRISDSKLVLDTTDSQHHPSHVARTEKNEGLHSTPEKRPQESSQRSSNRSRGTPDKRWSQSSNVALSESSAGSMAAPPAPLPHTAVQPPSTPPPTTPLTPMGGLPTTPTSTSGTPGRFLRIRHRTTSSGSEPELVPVVQKLETIPLYEAIFRETSGTAGNSSVGGIKLPGRVPELIQPIRDRRPAAPPPGTVPVGSRDLNMTQPPANISKEMQPPDLIRPFVSETRDSDASSATDSSSTLIPIPDIAESTTSPDAPTPTPTPTTATASQPVNQTHTASPIIAEVPKVSENHKSEKKKKEKHKNKEKEKYREDKERKHRGHRHRTKDKDGSHSESNNFPVGDAPSIPAIPIRITIPKDKINLSSTPSSSSSSKSSKASLLTAQTLITTDHSTPSPSLKIKIPKDRLKGTSATSSPQQSPAQISIPTGGIKIKISKDMIRDSSAVTESVNITFGGRKRDRDRSPANASVSSKVPRLDVAGPTSTVTPSSTQRRSYKQSGVEKRQHQQPPMTVPPPGSKVPQKLDSSYQYKGCLQ